MVERVVVAPDKFKGSLSATDVATRVAAGLARAGFDGETVPVPVADGGDGTVAAAVAAGYRRVDVEVPGPVGNAVSASFAVLDGTAVIEAAQACGLTLLPSGEFAPLTATSRGVGELILAARRLGAKRIVLGVGGVATTDGGAGLVEALGARLLDDNGRELPGGGAALNRLAELGLSGLRDLSGVEFWLASDVDNPLLGRHGAASVYGPQKGASDDDVRLLEAGLARWADMAEAAVDARRGGVGPQHGSGQQGGDSPRRYGPNWQGGSDWHDGLPKRFRIADEPGAGAAGGLGFAALLFLGARMRPGIELVLELASFSERLDGARLVITGEGSLDAQTLHGKTPVGVARAAAAHQPPVPVVAVAGRCTLSPDELRAAGISAAYAITDIESDVARCMAEAGPLVERLTERIAAEWLG
ncbi:MAG: glycerate kinase [Trebonia sp.]|jgi:glycerate kinase